MTTDVNDRPTTSNRRHTSADPSVVSPPSRPERTSSRHPGDAIRAALGLGILGLALLSVHRDALTAFERDLFRVVNDLPQQLLPFVVPIMQAGNITAAPIAAVAAVVARSRRLALDLLIAGPLAYVEAKLVKQLISRPRPGGLLEGVVRHGSDSGMGFVSGHAAVVAALATAAGPYLPRRWRRITWVVVTAVGLARIYVGAHLPLDVVGGAALGWATGAAVHLILGAPRRVPTLDDARDALALSGFTASAVRRVPGARQGSYPFTATSGRRLLFVKLLDPEPRDRDWIFRIARFLAFRDVRDEAMLEDTGRQAEHETAMALLAAQAGCRVPAVRAVEHRRAQTWIVEDLVGARSLADLEAEDLSDELLAELWRQLDTLHDAGLVHRDLVAENIVIDDSDRPWLVDFAHARHATSAADRDGDIAELLLATARVAGPSRATVAALGALGAVRVAGALAELQPLARTAATRRDLRHDSALLPALRSEVEQRTGAVSANTTSLRVDRAAAAASFVAAAILVTLVLVAGPGDVLQSDSSTTWRWCAVAMLAGIVTWVQGAALIIAVTGRRLALGRTTLVRTITAAGPSVFGTRSTAIVHRYLARTGMHATDVDAALQRRRVVRATVGTGLTAAFAVAAVGGGAHRGAIGIALAAAADAGLVGSAWRHRRVSTSGLPVSGWVVAMVAGALECVATAVVLVGAEKAAAGGTSLVTVALVGIALATVVALVGGGPGVVDVAVISALVAVGSTFAPAVGAVLLARGITFWTPVVLARPLVSQLSRRLVL